MRIVTIQLDVSDSETRSSRLERANALLEEIYRSDKKPDLVILPEIWGCGFFDFDNYKALSEKYDGETYGLIQGWAKKLGSYILSGSFVEERDGKHYNTSVFFDRNGEVLGDYQKIHLFGFESKEHQILDKGQKVTVIDTEFGQVGLATCYDLRFPEQFRKMVNAGVNIFLIVSAWPTARLGHWRLFNQVRALENQCFLVSCNCAGTQNGSQYAGHSMGVAPTGEILWEADEKACVIWNDIDPAQVSVSRSTFPALADQIEL